MKVSVVGVGYVGLVAAACLAEGGNHVVCVDNDQKKIDDLNQGVIPIYEPGLTEIVKKNVEAGRLIFTTDLSEGVAKSLLVFIGVGTPSADDGSADISAVLAVAKDVARCMDGYRIVVTKSTVPVGTHKKVSDIISSYTEHPFDYVSNPEFLKEGSAVDDFLKPDRVIIGTTNPAVMEIMKQLYAPFMRKKSRMIFMDPASAEMAKYAANAMLATRITFMNELSGLCDELGADIEMVRHGIGSDGRIGSSFLFAGLGYGGSCFPKDVRALSFMGDGCGCEMTLAKAVQAANYKQQDRFAERVIEYYKNRPETTLAAWGLAFKARTDDVRESPALRCVNKFIAAGIKVKAYDPEAMETAVADIDGKVEMGENAYDILNGCDGLVIMTDWQEFRSPAFDDIKDKLNKAVIFDGRNLYEPPFVAKQGIEYHSIGRVSVFPQGVQQETDSLRMRA
ncbi:UDP-glucose 6-dehydrogenase TuaD [Anaerohalosphaera lusitana]|uniref:UDP-glucose 6-dehydrogenase n=1 Tax=Anaerohalosphaera lusitana TaxID=1936003 RepID=A0A1U9NLG6_9BACT|nr:UDP-glucose/GDP-mannose dehydrogenase family protein [Anaerohalosphaera lusitana]AQT68336.1 UDP-glucose 6-dehydrogenase TuaD [Anaerohalosphaera lusitana]